jgi:hypothetical protein
MRSQKSITKLKRLLFIVCCICVLFSASIFGKTPGEYKQNISEGRKLILRLLYPETAEKMSVEDQKKYESETIKDIREKIPATEKIEWDGTIIETENSWLVTKLNDFENEPKDSPKRSAILNEIEERLSAVEKKVAELESPPLSNRTKDEDKQKLAEILRREEFQKPVEEEKSLFQRFWDWLKDFLDRLFPKVDLPQTPVTGSQPLSFVMQIVLFAVILGLIGFLAYRFAPFFMTRFRRKEKSESKDRVILGEKLTPDQNSSNLFSDAERLALEGDLRGAIRKGYIALLCELNDRKIIGLSQHKTNRDYLQDVRKRRELYENMNGLTLNFERHWYGFDSAETSDWEEFKSGYKKAVSSKQ